MRSPPGGAGGRTSPSGPGAPCARTTAPTATPGTTSPTTSPARAAYRWGEDGLAGDLRPLPDPGLRPRPLERARPDPEGAPLRPRARRRATTARTSRSTTSTSTPRRRHSYMKWLYKYPQREYPYQRLVEENRRRGGPRPGVRAARHRHLRRRPLLRRLRRVREGRRPRTWSSASPSTTAGPEAAPLHVLPHLWFRNTWAWGPRPRPEPSIVAGPAGAGLRRACVADDTHGGAAAQPALPLPPGPAPPLRRRRAASCCSPTTRRTRAALRARARAAASRTSRTPSTATSSTARRRRQPGRRWGPRPACDCRARGARRAAPSSAACGSPATRSTADPLGDVDAHRRRSARRRPTTSTRPSSPPRATADEKLVQRQAFAGMLWSKQIYLFDVNLWLEGDNPSCAAAARRAPAIRNTHWRHLNSMRILSMPDKWEYPWFAAWDLAFHCAPLALVDPEFAKEQLWLLLFEQFQHPSGQIPAYEWEFSDLNPPVHAWAVWRVYNMDRIRTGKARPRVPGEVLPQAADQLRLVGQQGRPRGQQRLRGRLPRPRQHHGHRPQRAAARRAPCSSSPTPPAGWACSA